MSFRTPVGLPQLRCAHASRIAVLLDNQAYFEAVYSTLQQAQRSVMIVGWHFDPRCSLLHGSPEEMRSSRLGDVLRRITARNRDLRVRVLVWDMPLVISMMRSFYPQRASEWFDGNVQLILDDKHPVGACRHDKLVVVDDSIAYCSGTDFAVNRWDSAAHLDTDVRRRLPSGTIHPARHAVSMVLEGEIAGTLAELCAERWCIVSGEAIARSSQVGDVPPWPAGVPADINDVEVAIARTEPRRVGSAGIYEIEQVLIAGIRAAQRSIYIEDQYFANVRIAKVIAERLQECDGPEVMVITSRRGATWFDRLTMDAPRDELIHMLRSRDRQNRFGIYTPLTPERQHIIVHSKLMIVDQWLLRIGSANLNNRSMRLDSECDLIVDAHALPPAHRSRIEGAIRRIALKLLSHQLAVPTLPPAAGPEHGQANAAIAALQVSDVVRLESVEPESHGLLGHLVARYHLGDPESPRDTWRPWRRRWLNWKRPGW